MPSLFCHPTRIPEHLPPDGAALGGGGIASFPTRRVSRARKRVRTVLMRGLFAADLMRPSKFLEAAWESSPPSPHTNTATFR